MQIFNNTLFILFGFILPLQGLASQNESKVVSVGTYDNPPKIFRNDSDEIKGIFPEILDTIAKAEGWKIVYIHGTWEESLDRLNSGDIDIMPDVAFTKDRQENLDFNEQIVLSSWSSVYTKNLNPRIISLLDLQNQRISVLSGSIQERFLRDLNKTLPNEFNIISSSSFRESFTHVMDGEADAAVANHFVGDWLNRDFPRLHSNDLVFNPVALHIATKKGENREILARIDEQLAKLKSDQSSSYYDAIERWNGNRLASALLVWRQVAFWVISGLIIAIALVILFKWQLTKRTKSLKIAITKSNQLNSSLQKQENLFRIFMDNLPASAFIKDQNFRCLYVNNRVSLISGKPKEEIIGKTNHEIYPPDIAEKLSKDDDAALNGKTVINEVLITNKKGEDFWIEGHKFPLPEYGDGTIKAMAGFGLNITERKNAETKLRNSEALYKLALEIGKVGTFEWDIPNNKIHWSNETKLIFGYNKDEPAPSFEELESRIHPDFRTEWKSDLNNCIENGLQHELDIQIIPKNRKEAWVHVMGSLITDDDGHSIKLFGVVVDITNRIEQNNALLKAKEAAEKANQAKSEFLAVMNHELRTPLNTIIGPAELLAESTDDSEEKETFLLIKESANQLLALINDILDLARIESKAIALQFKDVELKPFLYRRLLPIKAAAQKKGIEVNTIIAPTLPQFIHTDPDLLLRVLINIVGNALKFTAKGSIDIHVDSKTLAKNSHEVLNISVKDTGPGIPPDLHEKIFEGFQQADMSLNRPHEGTGLGLTISRNLMHLIKGDIILKESTPKGSTFVIRFPLITSDHLSDQSASPEPKTEEPPPLILSDKLQQKRILVVDDTKLNLELFRLFLNKLNLEAEYANNGEEALSLCAKNDPFDIIFMDVRLPGIDGVETTRRLRKINPKSPLYIIAQTSYAETAQKEYFLSEGMNDFLPKPIRFNEFQKTLHRALNALGASG